MKKTGAFLGLLWFVFGTGCRGPEEAPVEETPTREAAVADSVVAARSGKGTCQGPYRSFWSHPTNEPPPGAPHFLLSQDFPKTLPDIDAEPWKDYLPWKAETLEERGEQSEKYLRALLDYIFEGNVSDPPAPTDFDLCTNPVRSWYHVPWLDANPSKGREYKHGMTRELTTSARKLSAGQKYQEAAWAVGFYNARGAYTIGQIFPGTAADAVNEPLTAIKFPEGTVVGKVLFTSALPAEVDYLKGAPIWQANVLPPPCGREFTGTATDPRTGETVKCERGLRDMRLVQFDVAVVDQRSPLGWVFGTFVYNGLTNPDKGWYGLEPLGLMWSNDPKLKQSGTDPGAQPPGERGLTPPENVTGSHMFTSALPPWLRKDLGCAGRLDGPIDNPRSSCMSCHATASVPIALEEGDKTPCGNKTAIRGPLVKVKILGDFAKQCGKASVDEVWFRDIQAGTPFDSSICKGREWVSLDYSLQLSEALANFMAAKRSEIKDVYLLDNAEVFPAELSETER